MDIAVLHIDECPNWKRAGELLGDVLAELCVFDVRPRFILIHTAEDAAATRFAGSPTILIDGVDPFKDGVPTTELACRVYRDGGRMAGLPSRESLRLVIADALAASATDSAPTGPPVRVETETRR